MAEKEDEIGRGRDEMRELSVKAYNIDLLLLPINYPQKLFEPDTRKTGMGGEIGRGSRVAAMGRERARDRGKIGQAPQDEKNSRRTDGSETPPDEKEGKIVGI